MRPILLSVPLVFGLACSSPSPPATRYLLRGDLEAGSGRMDAPVKVGLGRLVVAPYLSGSHGIVIETGSGEVQAARQHQWAEPVEAGIRAFLNAEIGTALGYPLTGSYADRPTWDYRIDVVIDRLHGTMEGSAVLESRYRITSAAPSQRDGEFYFVRSKPLPREGYGGVVDAETALLRELAASIASSVREAVGHAEPGAPRESPGSASAGP